ncbi:MAG: YihY/virulence factor BrkB family protein [Candidatus Aminicenantes bacterium]|jgi:Predicted membrane protein|nr:YihY/virulence factor BrkB family protein [Candidatus Aminicenantes bacterium]
MTGNIFQTLIVSFKKFNDDHCWTAAIVISYFALLCLVPLIALFAFLAVKVMGSSEVFFRSLNVFTEDFFVKMDPSFFKKLQALGGNISNLGWFGFLGSLVAASFLFSNLISTLNRIFKAKTQRSFFYNRLIEYVVMLLVGVILLLSISITAVWAALQRSIRESTVLSEFINPKIIDIFNNFFFQYALPLGLTFLVLFALYKFIPEVKVHTRSALIGAAVASILWEIFKRGFAFYVIHLSAVGVVLSKMLAGTLTSVIFFLLWISSSLIILLWGAELAAVSNEYLERLASQKSSGKIDQAVS